MRKPAPLILEELEPRILYSADTAALVPPDALTPQAELHSTDTAAVPAAPAAQSAAVEHTRREIAFVDTGVADYQRVLDDLKDQQESGRSLDVIVLDAARDGVEQIGEALEGREEIDVIHIFSHGTAGAIKLGNVWLSQGQFSQYGAELQSWRQTLAEDADILIYGCDVAANEAGQQLLAELAYLTGADVGASTDATGSALRGGDWTLEHTVGAIESAVAVSADLQHDWAHVMAAETLLDTFTVQSYSNNEGSQSWASDWVELDSTGAGAAGGNIQVNSSRLNVEPQDPGDNIYREANLSGALSATLSYDYDNTAFGGATQIDVQVSSNGGAGYTVLKSYTAFAVASSTDSFDITPYIASNTRIRFFVVATNNNDFLRVDNFQIAYVTNTAPALDNTKSPALNAQTEDVGAPSGAVGTLVSALVDFAVPAGQVDNVTDPDTGATLGIAVTAASTTNGSWFYSTNNGTAWNALGAVADNNARLLAADASTRLYFQPNANFNGTLANAVTFRAWDRTSGTNGTLASTSTNGGTTAFSSATDTASLTVNPIADTPSVTNATTNEDTQSSSGLVVSRNAGDAAEVTHLKVTGITNGTLFLNDGVTAIANGAFITFAQANAGLRFTPTANFSGAGSFTVQASTSNVDAGLGGATASATITVNAVNDAPSLAGATLAAVNEDTLNPAGQVISTIFSGQFADIDAGASFSGIAVVGNAANAGTEGTWQYSSNGGTNWFAVGAVSDGATALAVSSASRIRFVPAADYNGTPPALVLRGLDNTYAGGFSSTAGAETRITVNTSVNGGSTAIAAATANLSTTINAVNDAPVVAAAAVTVTRGQTVALSDANFTITDPDNAAFTYTVSGVTGGYFQLASAPGAPVTTFTSADLTGNLVQFVDDGDAVAPAFSVTVSDGVANSNTLAGTVTFNLVNSAPALDNTKTPVLGALSEDAAAPAGAVGTLVSSLIDFAAPAGQLDNVTDADVGAVLGIAVVGADTANGTWFYSTNNGAAWNALGAVSNTNARLLAADAGTRLYFQPNADWNGTLAGAITFRAWDRTSGVAGATADVTITTTFLDQFNAVSYTNNNGTANWSTGWIEEEKFGGNSPSGGNVRVTGGELRMTPEAANASSIRRLANLTGATSATLTFDYNNALAAGDQFVIAASSDGWATWTVLPGIVFDTATNTGVGSMSVDISPYISANTGIAFGQAADGGSGFLFLDNVQITATRLGGGTSPFSSATDTASLVVNPIADTPSVTNATTNEDTQSSSGLVISRNANDGAEVTHFKVTGISNGTLFKNDGVTQITDGTFITFAEGSAGLKFTPTGNFNGSGSFTVQASTSNNDAGLGGSTASATITVNAVNDPPVVGSAALTLNEGQTVTLAAANFGVTDPDNSAFTYTVSGVSGGFFQLSSAPGTPITSFTSAQLSGAVVQFVDDGNEIAPAFSVTVNDGAANSNTRAATITYNPVNDAPVITAASLTVDEGQTVTLSGANFSVTDGDNAAFTYTVSAVARGRFQLSNAPGTPITSFTSADLAGGFVQFVHDGTEGAPTFNVRVNDGLANSNTFAVASTYTPLNDAPVVMSAALTVNEGQTVTLTGANFSVTDPDNAAFTYTVS
ncbi:MAG TPA: cadherin-like domain-containing protein, partial [Burkholderiales bacterium]|nr:cadherin-like domain-containing protein [Burkholderiales bacterium]